MKMTKQELFSIIQEFKPVNKQSKISGVDEAIKKAREFIPDNDTEYLCVQVLNIEGTHLDSLLFSSSSRNGLKFDIIHLLRKIIAIPGAASIIMIHNHPYTSTLKPSKDDIATAMNMAVSFGLIGLVPIDFEIINHNEYYSFRESRPALFKKAVEKVNKLMK